MRLKQLWIFAITSLMLIGCSSSPKRDPNLPKMPYQEWHIGARYPDYFPAKVFYALTITQTDEWRRVRPVIGSNQNKDIINWSPPSAAAHSVQVASDLPKDLYICWVSFVDQTFYRTHIQIPLEVRLEMVKPHTYYSYVEKKDAIAYNNRMILGFAPGGNVIGWLVGVPREGAIEFTQVTSQNVGSNSEICLNPYQDGKIPQISDKAKAWLKANGMPSYWQEPTASTQP